MFLTSSGGDGAGCCFQGQGLKSISQMTVWPVSGGVIDRRVLLCGKLNMSQQRPSSQDGHLCGRHSTASRARALHWDGLTSSAGGRSG